MLLRLTYHLFSARRRRSGVVISRLGVVTLRQVTVLSQEDNELLQTSERISTYSEMYRGTGSTDICPRILLQKGHTKYTIKSGLGVSYIYSELESTVLFTSGVKNSSNSVQLLQRYYNIQTQSKLGTENISIISVIGSLSLSQPSLFQKLCFKFILKQQCHAP